MGFGWVLGGFSLGVLAVARGCFGFFGRKRTRFAQTPLFGQKNQNTPTPCVTLRVYPEVTMVCLGLSLSPSASHFRFQQNSALRRTSLAVKHQPFNPHSEYPSNTPSNFFFSGTAVVS